MLSPLIGSMTENAGLFMSYGMCKQIGAYVGHHYLADSLANQIVCPLPALCCAVLCLVC